MIVSWHIIANKLIADKPRERDGDRKNEARVFLIAQKAQVAACYFKRGWISVKSRLRSVEHIKEDSDAEAGKRMDERREQDYRRKQTPQNIDDVEDEHPH
jgi:hypothetical protein